MWQRAMSGSGSGDSEKNRLIFADDIQTNYYQALTFYDTDFFEYVSGSQRIRAANPTDITLKAKFSGTVTIFWGIQSSGVFYINGTSISLNSGCNDVVINKGDTVRLYFAIYYNSMLMFYNCDRSTWQGGNIG